MGCTTILVGKKASYDGSTMIARNDDSGSGHYMPKKFVVVHPEEQPRKYKSVISHVEIDLPDDPMGYTSVPNAVDGEGIWAASGVNEANVGISVDTAVDAAKDAADVVLLQKDLNVLEQGVLEGRKTFTNMLKYIKITASSNFGNIFSIICASAFLPFLPMTSIQILLLNLLYDTLCIVLPWDNVDEEEILSPRDWSGKTLKQFMLSFGPISSLFDIVTFLFLYYFLCPALCGGTTYLQLTDPSLKLQYAALFQTGWFLESMWTQVLILHFLRTAKIPFLQSRASAPVISITLVGILAFTALTFTSGASLFGLTKLPLWYFAFLLLVAFFYMLLSSVTKYFYKNKYQELI